MARLGILTCGRPVFEVPKMGRHPKTEITYESYVYADVNAHQFHIYKIAEWVPLSETHGENWWTNGCRLNPHPFAAEFYLKHTRTSDLSVSIASLQHPDAIQRVHNAMKSTNGLHTLKYVLSNVCSNPHPWVVRTILEHPKIINWGDLSSNPNPLAIKALKKRQTQICWSTLSRNPHPWAIKMLKRHRSRISWDNLSRNPHPWAIKMLQKYPERIRWDSLSANPHPWAIRILSQNCDKANLFRLAQNPGIFEICGYHYARIRDRNGAVCSEVRANRMNPRNHSKWPGWGF